MWVATYYYRINYKARTFLRVGLLLMNMHMFHEDGIAFAETDLLFFQLFSGYSEIDYLLQR